MFKWIFLVFSIMIISELISRLLWNFYLEFHEYNEKIINRIDVLTLKLLKNNERIFEPDFITKDFKRMIFIPTTIQRKFINFVEAQNDLHWRVQGVWIFKMIFMTRMQKVFFIKGLIKQYERKNVAS